ADKISKSFQRLVQIHQIQILHGLMYGHGHTPCSKWVAGFNRLILVFLQPGKEGLAAEIGFLRIRQTSIL
ncbi:MAG: hypothetical protein PHY82_02175, partial [Lentisphaeria bacterium]|nr:hypothetical protein [Lentisphaeria bacterium]